MGDGRGIYAQSVTELVNCSLVHQPCWVDLGYKQQECKHQEPWLTKKKWSRVSHTRATEGVRLGVVIPNVESILTVLTSLW